MPGSNTELARRMYDGIARRDLDAMLELADPDVTFYSRLSPAQGGEPYRGHAGVREWWTEMFSSWEEFSLTPEQFLEIGDHVLVIAHLHARGPASGIVVDDSQPAVFTFRDGKAILARTHNNVADALLDLERRVRPPSRGILADDVAGAG